LKKEKADSPPSKITKNILPHQTKTQIKRNAIHNSNKYDKTREQSENKNSTCQK